jgi:2'-5' RNA ligase
MRCFIALNINEQVRNQFERLQKELDEKSGLKTGTVKWANPDLVHLTLKFLGEVPDRDIAGVCRVVEELAKDHKCFSIDIGKLGCFESSLGRS